MEENLELEQDIDVDLDDDADLTDVEVDTDSDDEDGDGGVDLDEATDPADDEVLEYDEDGNVIESNESDDNNAAAQDEERETNPPEVPDAPHTEQAYDEREAMIRDLLKAMGVEAENIDDGLAQLTADTKGVSVESYKKDLKNARQVEEAQEMYRKAMLQRMIDSDMKELHSLFPETKTVTKFEELPNARRYAELRDMGLNPKEAYSAANPDARREAVAASVKQQAINASKSHLKSNVPIGAKDTSVKISRGEMEMYREMFPNKSDKEILALYKKTK